MIQDSVNKVIYAGNGEATEFFYPFQITKNTDVKVMTVSPEGVETVLTNDYYVDVEKRIVIYPGWADGEEPNNADEYLPLADGWRLVVYREVDFTQEVSMFKQYPFDVLEGMIDKNTILAQQLKDETDRSMRLGVAVDNTDINMVIPHGQGTSFRWSDDGRRLEVTEDPAKVLPKVNSIYAQTQEAYNEARQSADEAKDSADKAEYVSKNVNIFIPSVSSEGVVSWTNKAGISNPTPVNIKGPKGDKGDKGDTGPQGEKGTGLTILGEYDSYEELVANHPTGTAGASYLIDGELWYWAAEQGKWASAGPLRGEKGDKGDKGDQGIQGVQGKQGEIGPQGPQGAKGDTGAKGDRGEQGLQGIQGEQGPQGEKGDKGDTGPQGQQGIQGPQGPQGDKGDKGDKGDQGIQGLQGPQGKAGADGVSGVYIGSDQPTSDAIKVWIVPDGTYTTEQWVFTMADGTEIIKEVYIK